MEWLEGLFLWIAFAVVWIAFAVVTGRSYKKKGYSFAYGFCFSFFFGAMLGLLNWLFLKPKIKKIDEEGRRVE